MPERVIKTFDVKRLEILDESGTADESLMPPIEEGDIRRIYELMTLSRIFDERALSLQREGRIGTYPSILGQEAAQVGSAFALEKTDWVFPSFRETGMYVTMGYPLHLLFQYWAGDERGVVSPEGLNIVPVSVSVGTHIPHAVGAAMAARYRRDRIAVVAYFGDGGTSKGDFHEGFNFAGVFRPPVVFICQNNQWAISVPRSAQTGAKTLAQKGIAAGLECLQVDGNDLIAMRTAMDYAIKRARHGHGGMVIEAVTYRLSDHTTADDARRYRPDDEVKAAWEREPVRRMKAYLASLNAWTDEEEDAWKAECAKRIDAEVNAYLETKSQPVTAMFDYTYADVPADLAAQRAEAIAADKAAH